MLQLFGVLLKRGSYCPWMLLEITLVVFMLLMLLSEPSGLSCYLTMVNSTVTLLAVDTEYFALVAVVTLATVSVLVVVKYYLLGMHECMSLSALLVCFVASMIILLVGRSAIWLFMGWDGLGLSSFLLVACYKNWLTANNSIITYLSARSGDAFLFLLVATIVNPGMWLLPWGGAKVGVSVAILVILTGMTKSAIFPMVSWLPQAMAAPTPVSALVHSSTLVTAGLILMMMWQNAMNTLFTTMMLTMGAMTATPAGILAFNESDFKKLVAFSTLSQVGLMLIILSSTKYNLFLFHLMSHALFKSMLFMCLSVVLTSYTSGQQESRKVQTNLMLSMTSYSLMCLTGVNLCGIWSTTGFWSKEAYLLTVSPHLAWMWLGVIGLSMVYTVKMLVSLASLKVGLLEKSSTLACSFILLSTLNVTWGLSYATNLFIGPSSTGYSCDTLLLVMMTPPLVSMAFALQFGETTWGKGVLGLTHMFVILTSVYRCHVNTLLLHLDPLPSLIISIPMK